MRFFRSAILARLIVGSVLLGFLSGAAGTVTEADAEHPRQTWQRALADGTLDRAIQQARSADDVAASDAQVAVFLDVLAEAPGGDRLVAYLSTVADPADVLRALLGTSHLGAAMPFMLGDTWMAPAPPSSSTLGARALAAASLGTPIHRPARLFGMAPVGDVDGAPVPRERYPAVQPLGP
ncbi:MAG: hypothetical protein AAFY55_15585 [Bacteroidota bacterium]